MRWIATFILVIIIACHDTTERQKPVVTHPADTLKLIELFSFNDVENASLYIIHDTVLFLVPDHPDHPEYCFTRTIFYDSLNKRFQFGLHSPFILYAKTVDSLAKSPEAALIVKSIGNLEINYSKLKKELKPVKVLKEIINPGTKIQFYKGQYYFIGKETPRAMFKYDPVIKKLSSFQLSEMFMNVIGFVLYDMDRDGDPEIFIFQTGLIPRDYVVSYTIYSIRTNSVIVSLK